MVEVLVSLSIVGLMASLIFPAMRHQIRKSKLGAGSSAISSHLLKSRFEAMKLGLPIVVVPDYVEQGLFAFVDADGDLAFDEEERQLYRLSVPGSQGLSFMGPDGQIGSADDPAESVVGFTEVGAGSSLRVAVFDPDGSIRDPGAFRLADGRQPQRNVLEIRVEPRATARVSVLKFLYEGPDGDGFYPSGAGIWEWY